MVITRGGVFDSTDPEPENTLDGTMEVTFQDCETGTITYDIESLDLQGVVPIQRIAPDNVPLCEALADE